jgi:oxygen-independent coproporphyrinogen-3 oxidase
VVGIGAGARGYFRDLDYRNGYSLRPRRTALEAYGDKMGAGVDPKDSGFVLDVMERMRRFVILGLLDLDLAEFKSRFGLSVLDVFGDLLSCLISEGFLMESEGRLRATDLGFKYRDTLVLGFFSEDVYAKSKSFDYLEAPRRRLPVLH